MTHPLPSVVVLVADGVRPDTLAAAMDAGQAPALARLRADGGAYRITTTFPSVTGLAYLPFVAGRHPVTSGIPGLRWFDRARTRLRGPAHARSYVGWAMRHFDADLHDDVETLFQRATPAFGAMTMVARGLPHAHWMGRSLGWQLRGARVHFLRGGLSGWRAFDRDVAAQSAEWIRREQPRFSLVAILSPDKASHAHGHASDETLRAIQLVDDAVAAIRRDAERDGRWDAMHLWVVSDHGHAAISQHDELVETLADVGVRAVGHPLMRGALKADAAVAVSGNAMAHVYYDPARTTRLLGDALEGRWREVTDALVARPATDLAIIPTGPTTALVRSAARGDAELAWQDADVAYAPRDGGDPLGLGGALPLTPPRESWELTRDTRHPDSLVQIARTAAGARSGDVILSANPDWDFRRKFEPVLHVSGHGSLRDEQMWVPLVTNRPWDGTPRRTVDIAARAARLLGVPLLTDPEADAGSL